MTNTNNPIEFLLNLGINTTGSQQKIVEAIRKIQKDVNTDVEVDLKVNSNNKNDKTFSQMENQIKELQLQIKKLNGELSGIGMSSGGNKPFKEPEENARKLIFTLEQLQKRAKESNAALSFDYQSEDISKVNNAIIEFKNHLGEIQKIKFKAFETGDGELQFEALGTTLKNLNYKDFIKNQQEATGLLREFELQGKMSAENISKFRKEIEGSFDNKELSEVVTNLKQANAEASREIKHSAMDGISKSASELNAKLHELANNTGISTTTEEFKALDNATTQLANKQIFNDQDLKDANAEIRKLTTEFNTMVTSATKFESVNQKIQKLTTTMGQAGQIDSNKLASYGVRVQKIAESAEPTSVKVRELNLLLNEMNATANSTAHSNKMAQGMEKAKQEIDKLTSSLVRAEKQWKRTINTDEVAKLKIELAGLKVPNFTTQAELDGFMNKLGGVSNKIKRINADATQSARNSMGVIESFRIAMERFPVWMAASTIFYGAIRGVSDLTTKVIELDTHMTNLRRVMDMPDHKFNEMLEQSIENVTLLSGKMQDYMKLIEEFGRMGFNDIETIDMSNTAQTLQNISDLNAEETVNALVAAMISFNIAAEDSVSIADKINEVDNNFSVTSRNLAQGLNKASATAKTFGR